MAAAPFEVRITDAEIADLRERPARTRWPEPDASPLVITHAWPGSVLEFLEVLGPLTDPRAHGGDPADAFHVVAPSLPGCGWSDTPSETGWGVQRIAARGTKRVTALTSHARGRRLETRRAHPGRPCICGAFRRCGARWVGLVDEHLRSR